MHDPAFPYLPPDDAIRARYAAVFERRDPLPDRWAKAVFDRAFGALALVFTAPLFVGLLLANLVEGLLIPAHRGSLITSYNAVSRGKIIKKYKIRVVKAAAEDAEAARRGEWQPAEWSKENRTYVGLIAKKFYLDEIPQFFSLLTGDISLVGPRPLAVIHYERDLAQGNVTRKLVKGGLVGPTQALKGTDRFGSPEVEYAYVEKYMTLSSVGMLLHDLGIILRCGKVMLQGKGL